MFKSYQKVPLAWCCIILYRLGREIAKIQNFNSLEVEAMFIIGKWLLNAERVINGLCLMFRHMPPNGQTNATVWSNTCHLIWSLTPLVKRNATACSNTFYRLRSLTPPRVKTYITACSNTCHRLRSLIPPRAKPYTTTCEAYPRVWRHIHRVRWRIYCVWRHHNPNDRCEHEFHKVVPFLVGQLRLWN